MHAPTLSMAKNQRWLFLPPAIALLLVLGPLSMSSGGRDEAARRPPAARVGAPADRPAPRTPGLWQIGSTLCGVLLLGGALVFLIRRAQRGPSPADSHQIGLLVEFVGMPGVGKSELSHRIAARLAAAGERVREPSYELAHGPSPARRRCWKSLHVVRQLALDPLSSLRALAAIGRTQQRGLGMRVRLVVNALLVASLAAQARRRPGIHLLDQGLLQAAWSVALEDRPGAPLPLLDTRGLCGAIADLVVIVDADLGTVQRRLSERPGRESRLEQEGVGPEALQRGARLVGELRAAVKRGRLARVIEADNDAQGPDRLAADVAAQIADFARTAATAADGVRAGLDPSPTEPRS
jgi:hypothetical protein